MAACSSILAWRIPGTEEPGGLLYVGANKIISGYFGKIPWRRQWLPTLVFWPGEFHGQRSLVVYSLWVRKESDMTLTHLSVLYELLLFELCHSSSLSFSRRQVPSEKGLCFAHGYILSTQNSAWDDSRQLTNALCGLLIVFFVTFVCKHLTIVKDILFNRYLYNLALSTILNFIIVNFINSTIFIKFYLLKNFRTL